MDIEVYADVVCPWCYIGTRRLTEALATYDDPVTVRYRPFQLNSAPVTEPRPLLDALAEKFGGPERVRQMTEHVTAVAARSGIELHFDRAIAANTFDAHRLVWFAERADRPLDMLEALYRAHFVDGVDLNSRSALGRVAGGIGLDEAEVRRFLDSTQGSEEVRTALRAARELGVTSVPTFVFAGKYAVTGAQEPETLRAALTEVRRREVTA